MSKIITRVFGGLGNQLFCYAAARRLSLLRNAELVIDNVSGFVHDHAYQRQYQLDHFHIPCREATSFERLEPFSRVRRMFRRKWNQHLPFEQRTYIQQQGFNFETRLLQTNPRGTVYLEGYWQSENYFKDVEEHLRQDLQIKPPTDATNLAMATQIRWCTAVAVHVRFFDEPHTSGSNNASRDFYACAVKKMESIAPDAHYFVFSDQPEIARALLPIDDGRITEVAHNQGEANSYADLWLMKQCKHFIIPRSTFSWWGAWLGVYEGKVVLVAKSTPQSAMDWKSNGMIFKECTQL